MESLAMEASLYEELVHTVFVYGAHRSHRAAEVEEGMNVQDGRDA